MKKNEGSRSRAAPEQGAKPAVEDNVRDFYDNFGWVEKSGVLGEDISFRMFRPAYGPYHAEVERRTEAVLGALRGKLLIAGCGDLPDSHVRIAQGFDEVSCLDISRRALDIARGKLGHGGRFTEASILNAPLADDSFDAVFCAHVIYHIDIDKQERAVDELIRMTRPGGRVVVIYSNPHSPLRYLAAGSARIGRLLGRTGSDLGGGRRPELYFARQPLTWWRRFEDRCSLSFQPWDAIGSYEESRLIPSDRLAAGFYAAAGWIERSAPGLAVRLWQYPLVLLDKRR
ncbi:methyltransferase domain-containing protein [Pelagibius litoralis]|uniref:Methyltransferase domain-containing protein n=1 Tax=Pelagibius litoralis TaxID=374515 RepID=A0A967KCA9_9PROT|nr:class I SAM-dependent methyltransferase [Pelagibius litoralis]NIA69570.1 methyltransferase domain-containing protein [Pelagibius litoralis]